MKHIIALAVLCCSLMIFKSASAQQDKSKRASPPAKVTQTIQSGATISVDYSQPKLNGRTIGKDVEPNKGKVWRMGANEATVFEADRDVLIDGQKLPAGKYSLFGLWGDDGFTVIFNKVSSIWGTRYDSIKDQDILKVIVKPGTATTSQDVLKYTIDKSGQVILYWGTMTIGFNVE